MRLRFDAPVRVTFGRHPENDVCFHGSRDIDASTRHAELVCKEVEGAYALRDLGSSNGTWIDGAQIGELDIRLGDCVEVEFGRGGPAVRIWLGGANDPLPARSRRPAWWRRFLRR